MKELKYRCIEQYHETYYSINTKNSVLRLSAFTEMMKDNFSGKNIKQKIINDSPLWAKMLNSKGFGKVKKTKVEKYRQDIRTAWKEISDSIDSNEDKSIYHTYAKFVWGLSENQYEPNALSIVESLIILNKFWKNKNMASIFVDYFGFVFNQSLTIDEIAEKSPLTRERIRQLKVKCINDFESNFSFFKEQPFRRIFDIFFEDIDFSRKNILRFQHRSNKTFKVNFSAQFYTKIIALIYNLNIIGNLNDAKSNNFSSSLGNVWNDIYLQTEDQKKKFDLEGLLNYIGKLNHEKRGYYKENIQINLKKYVTASLTGHEIETYRQILENEFDFKITLDNKNATILRNSYVSYYEYIEKALKDLGGLEYIDKIVQRLNEKYPIPDSWTEEIVRSTILRHSEFYTVGKSRLYGLKSINDVREIAGDGTLNDIMRLHIESKKEPIHLFDLLKNVNKVFPRKKSIHSIHSILEQDSRGLFKKFSGGFYGLENRYYNSVDFPKTRGFHGRVLRRLIRKFGPLDQEQLFKMVNAEVKTLPIQLEYLLFQAVETGDLKIVESGYVTKINKALDEVNPQVNDDLSKKIYEILNGDNFDDDLIHEAEYRKDPTIQVKIRQGQPLFRRALMILYNSECIISGCLITPILEAAHIMPHSQCADYSLSNGLLLRSDLHNLFDADLLAINPKTLEVCIHPIVSKDPMYSQYQNITIGNRVENLHINYHLNMKGLEWRWENFKESY